jgi:hypothetical protein
MTRSNELESARAMVVNLELFKLEPMVTVLVTIHETEAESSQNRRNTSRP